MLSSTVRSPYTADLEGGDAEARDRRGERRDVAAVEADAAVVGLEVAGDHVDQRGLAGAIAADQADALAGPDDQHDVGGGHDRAEAVDAVDVQQRRPGLGSRSRSHRHRRFQCPRRTSQRADAARQEADHEQENRPRRAARCSGSTRGERRTISSGYDEDRGDALPPADGDEANSPEVVEAEVRLGGRARTTSAPPRPPQKAATTKLIAIARRTEPPRYSTRSSFSRTASVTGPRRRRRSASPPRDHENRQQRCSRRGRREALAEQRRPAVEAVGAAERVELHQRP